MMKKNNYSAPQIELLDILIEQGYVLSGVTEGDMDYGDGGEGTPLD